MDVYCMLTPMITNFNYAIRKEKETLTAVLLLRNLGLYTFFRLEIPVIIQ